MKAIWRDTALAESNDTAVVEGNHYFPVDSLKREYFRASNLRTRCPWKDTANYLDVIVGDDVSTSAAWYYATPAPAAAKIKGRVAFWHGVDVAA